MLRAFPFVPTEGQKKLAGYLASFLFDDDPHSVFVLKGYAGTGKTSFMSALVRVLPGIRRKAVLLAPTGRAAKVFSGYSGQPAFTIHKRIYFQKMARDGTIRIKLQDNMYHNVLFIVDEASMIAGNYQESDSLFESRNLLDDLIEYVLKGDNCKLLLVGDTAQLPPVGMDISPALDIEFLKTRYELRIYQFELTEVMRQSLESGILYNATRMREMIAEETARNPLFILAGNSDVIRITGVELEDTLNHTYSASELGEAIVVTRSNKRANIYNKEIRKRILYREEELSTGDYMMVVRNNYFWLDPESRPGFIANGDIVEILRIRRNEQEHGFHFADVTIRLIDYPDEPPVDVKIILDAIYAEAPALSREDNKKLFLSVLDEHQDIPQRSKRFEKVRTDPYYNALQVKFAYAMTCHKTQGGQWENVFIDQGYLRDDQLNTEYLRWLYTALTRATKKVYLINFNERFF